MNEEVDSAPYRKPKIFYGWWIVAAGGVVQMYTAAVFWRGFSVFFVALIETFGWSRGATSAALSLQRLEGGAISPFVGTAINRFGRRRVMSFGIITTGLAFILMSFVQELWQFYLTVVLLTIGMSFGTFIILVSTVGNWFIRRRAQALAVLMATTAIGGLLLPFLQQAVDSFGWRDVLLWVGVGFWIVGLPAVIAMRGSPEQYGLVPDGGELPAKDETGKTPSAQNRSDFSMSLKAVLKTRIFWQLGLASSLGQMVSASNIVHIDALKSFDVATTLAATAVGFVALGDLVGRGMIVILGDRFDKRWILGAAYGIESVGILALSAVNWNSLGLSPMFVYAFAFGFGFGVSIPIRLAILADYFGQRNYASVIGVTSSVNALFQAAGAAIPGLIFDITMTYRPAFIVLALLLLLAIPMCLSLEKSECVRAKYNSERTSVGRF